MGGGFLRSLVWSMSGSVTRVETHGQGTSHNTPRSLKPVTQGRFPKTREALKKINFSQYTVYRKSSEVDCRRFRKARLQIINIKLSCTSFQLLSGQVLVGSVDCQRYQSLCQSQNVRAYPEIRLYSSNMRPDHYMWVYVYLFKNSGQIFRHAGKDFWKCHDEWLEPRSTCLNHCVCLGAIMVGTEMLIRWEHGL